MAGGWLAACAGGLWLAGAGRLWLAGSPVSCGLCLWPPPGWGLLVHWGWLLALSLTGWAGLAGVWEKQRQPTRDWNLKQQSRAAEPGSYCRALTIPTDLKATRQKNTTTAAQRTIPARAAGEEQQLQTSLSIEGPLPCILSLSLLPASARLVRSSSSITWPPPFRPLFVGTAFLPSPSSSSSPPLSSHTPSLHHL